LVGENCLTQIRVVICTGTLFHFTNGLTQISRHPTAERTPITQHFLLFIQTHQPVREDTMRTSSGTMNVFL
jgi:hypothetical protein